MFRRVPIDARGNSPFENASYFGSDLGVQVVPGSLEPLLTDSR